MKRFFYIIALMCFLAACQKNDDIIVVSREDGSGTRGVFNDIFEITLKNGDVITDNTAEEAVITNKTDVMLVNVSGNKNAIGYVSTGTVTSDVKMLEIDGIPPTAENIKNGSYTAARPFNIAIKEDVSAQTQDFIDFILSREGQDIISRNYIPVSDNPENYVSKKISGKITVAGSSSVTPVMEILKEEYLRINPGMQIEVQMSDSTSGISNVNSGICDIGMASRELKESEKNGLTSVRLAMDGIAVIVNKNNPTDNISKADVKAVFTGKKTKWSEISDE